MHDIFVLASFNDFALFMVSKHKFFLSSSFFIFSTSIISFVLYLSSLFLFPIFLLFSLSTSYLFTSENLSSSIILIFDIKYPINASCPLSDLIHSFCQLEVNFSKLIIILKSCTVRQKLTSNIKVHD